MPDLGSIKILVVDDDEIKRYSVVRVLRQAGFQCLEAATGEEALVKAAERPELIVLDVKLPGISGYEVCQQLKSDPELASIKVLHVSATYIDSDHRVAALARGADGYLVQPVDPGELVETVKALLRLREAEASSRHAAREWRATFDALSDGILLIDEQGTVLRCNRSMAAIIDKPFREIIGLPYREILRAEPATALDAMLRQDSSGYQAGAPEVAIQGRFFVLMVNPVLDETDRATGAVCVFSDMTERKRLEEELRARAEALTQADRAKDEFLAMLSHELRNPLGAISNALEVLHIEDRKASQARDGQATVPGAESPSVARARQVLDRQVATMKRLVDDLLDVSRITSGKITLRHERVVLEEIVGSVLRNLLPQMESKGLKLIFEATGRTTISGDPVRLDQVVTNLVTNAIRYTDTGSIHVTVRCEGSNAVLQVRDTGVGIRSETLPSVFEMFTQGARDHARAQGGLGIGLTLVRGMVELHGGTVEAHSEGEGLGSTFTVTLPVRAADSELPEASAPDTDASCHRRVLVVDDNTDAAFTMVDILETWGHSTASAADGLSALEAARSHRPEVVLLDIGLPRMDGYEVVRRLRQEPDGAKLVLVAMTGYGQAEDHKRTLAAGFDYHLEKPVNLAALQRILAKAL